MNIAFLSDKATMKGEILKKVSTFFNLKTMNCYGIITVRWESILVDCKVHAAVYISVLTDQKRRLSRATFHSMT